MIKTDSRKSPRTFALIHANKTSETSTVADSCRNIFQNVRNIDEGTPSTSNYFSTCLTVDTNQLTHRSDGKKWLCPQIEHLVSPKRKLKLIRTQKSQKPREEIFKVDIDPRSTFTTVNSAKLLSSSSSLPKKCKSSAALISEVSQKNQKNSQSKRLLGSKKISGMAELKERSNRWQQKTNGFLLRKAIKQEIVYCQDLRTRLGNQYFEQICRDRWKDQKMPTPYIYTLFQKQNAQKECSAFLSTVKRTHPEIIQRHPLKIKGVNRRRFLTQQQKK